MNEWRARIPLWEKQRNPLWMKNEHCRIMLCNAKQIFGVTCDQICAYKTKCVYAHSSNVCILPSHWSEWMDETIQATVSALDVHYCKHAYTNFISPNHIFCCDSQNTAAYIVHHSTAYYPPMLFKYVRTCNILPYATAR